MDARTPDLDTVNPAMTPAMALALQASFGTVERWREAFAAMAKAPAGGAGALQLAFQPREGRLLNQWSAGATQPVGDGIPLLAFGIDRPSNVGPDVDAFIEAIDWAQVYHHYQQAVEASSEAFGALLEDLQGARLLDVRRAGVFEQADSVIPGATWRDPQAVADWAASLPPHEPVVVYCVYGHEVGRSTALRLRAAGVDARFLRGGIDGWKAAGKPLRAKGEVS